jgi:hypothetical protein
VSTATRSVCFFCFVFLVPRSRNAENQTVVVPGTKIHGGPGLASASTAVLPTEDPTAQCVHRGPDRSRLRTFSRPTSSHCAAKWSMQATPVLFDSDFPCARNSPKPRLVALIIVRLPNKEPSASQAEGLKCAKHAACLPQLASLPGSPPKFEMLSRTHSSPAIRSSWPALPTGYFSLKPPSRCSQKRSNGGLRQPIRHSAQGQSDLRLNVLTPGLRQKLPVMVYIHGGGFTQGSDTLTLTYEATA